MPEQALKRESVVCAEAVVLLVDSIVENPFEGAGVILLPAAVVEKLTANDGELCPNLYVLGRKSTVKTSEGLKLVAVGGKYARGSDEAMSPYEPTFTDIDAQTAGKDVEQVTAAVLEALAAQQ